MSHHTHRVLVILIDLFTTALGPSVLANSSLPPYNQRTCSGGFRSSTGTELLKFWRLCTKECGGRGECSWAGTDTSPCWCKPSGAVLCCVVLDWGVRGSTGPSRAGLWCGIQAVQRSLWHANVRLYIAHSESLAERRLGFWPAGSVRGIQQYMYGQVWLTRGGGQAEAERSGETEAKAHLCA